MDKKLEKIVDDIKAEREIIFPNHISSFREYEKIVEEIKANGNRFKLIIDGRPPMVLHFENGKLVSEESGDK